MSSSKNRRIRMLDTINVRKEISINELSEIFKVSKVTIRSDLEILENEGFIFRSRGMALSLSKRDINEVHNIELTFSEKQHRNHKLKVRLANKAVKFIKDNETIMLDSGSTTLEIARQIAKYNWDRLTVITNSLPILNVLANTKGIEVISIGGRLRKTSKSFAGAAAEKALRELRFSKLFLSTDGYDLQQGITTHNEVEASLNRLMCDIATQIYIVTDYTKFGRQTSNWIRDFGDIDVVITDNGISEEYINAFHKARVHLLIIDGDNDKVPEVETDVRRAFEAYYADLSPEERAQKAKELEFNLEANKDNTNLKDHEYDNNQGLGTFDPQVEKIIAAIEIEQIKKRIGIEQFDLESSNLEDAIAKETDPNKLALLKQQQALEFELLAKQKERLRIIHERQSYKQKNNDE